MPTQAELDKFQDRTKAQSGTIGTVRRGGIHDISTQPRDDDNKEGTDERIQNDGIDTITSPLQDDDSGGGGLPAGYEEVTRDYVDDDNTAQQEWYLTKAI